MTRNGRPPLTAFDVETRLRMMSHGALLNVAEYAGRSNGKLYDAAVAKRIIRERIAAGDVKDLDFARCEALGVTA